MPTELLERLTQQDRTLAEQDKVLQSVADRQKAMFEVQQGMSKKQDAIMFMIHGDGNGQPGIIRKIDALSASEKERSAREARAEEREKRAENRARFITRSIFGLILTIVGHGIVLTMTYYAHQKQEIRFQQKVMNK